MPMEEITRLNVGDGEQIEAAFSLEGNCDAAVLYVHGFGSRRDGEKGVALAEACRSHRMSFAAFDFRGHGKSSGSIITMTGSRLLEDIAAVAAELKRRRIRHVCPVGSSMGGWVASWFTLQHPKLVSACVAIAPAFDFIRLRWSRISDEERAEWRASGRHRITNSWIDTEIGYCLVEEIDRFPLEHLCRQWSKPLLVYHGMADDTIGHSHSLTFVEQCAWAPIEVRLIKDGDHRLSAWKEQIADESCRFFQRYLSR